MCCQVAVEDWDSDGFRRVDPSVFRAASVPHDRAVCGDVAEDTEAVYQCLGGGRCTRLLFWHTFLHGLP